MNLARIVPGLAAAALVTGLAVPAVRADLVLPRPSPNAKVSQTVGVTDLSLTYSRPGVKGRKIWGELVPYGQPWRTGANEATKFTTSTEITVGGQKLAAGTYSLLTIPAEAEWTVVFSNQTDLWGAVGYDATKDAVRVKAKPSMGASSQEWMSLGFEDLTPNSANLLLRWEKLSLAVPITLDVNGPVLASARAEVAAAKADDWRTPYRAAQWCFDAGVALDEAKGWLQKSVGIQPGYFNQALLARWHHKDGNVKDAIATAEKAVAAGKAAKPPADVTGTEKLIAEWSGKK